MIAHAAFVSVDVLDGVLVIGFADDEHQPSEYFLVQRSIAADAPPYLERDDQAYGSFGEVRSVALKRDAITFVLTDDLAHALQVTPNFTISFDCPANVFDRLPAALAQAFAGTTCIVAA